MTPSPSSLSPSPPSILPDLQKVCSQIRITPRLPQVHLCSKDSALKEQQRGFGAGVDLWAEGGCVKCQRLLPGRNDRWRSQSPQTCVIQVGRTQTTKKGKQLIIKMSPLLKDVHNRTGLHRHKQAGSHSLQLSDKSILTQPLAVALISRNPNSVSSWHMPFLVGVQITKHMNTVIFFPLVPGEGRKQR